MYNNEKQTPDIQPWFENPSDLYDELLDVDYDYPYE